MKFFTDNLSNLWLLMLALVSGGTLLLPNLQRRGEAVSNLQATQLMNQGKALLLDVRDGAAFAAAHLRDARNIPLAELPKRLGEIDKFKAKAVIVICASGSASARAARQLRAAGFTNVASLSGGLTGWQAQGLPVAR